jgi:hypothetical protein
MHVEETGRRVRGDKTDRIFQGTPRRREVREFKSRRATMRLEKVVAKRREIVMKNPQIMMLVQAHGTDAVAHQTAVKKEEKPLFLVTGK